MSRGIHMRAPLADMRIQFGEETCSHDVRTLLIPVNCFACLIRKPRPARDSRCKLVRQVYISYAVFCLKKKNYQKKKHGPKCKLIDTYLDCLNVCYAHTVVYVSE